MDTIKMNFEPHTHSTYSDGKGTLRENISAAIACGLEKIALTDHAYRHMGYGIKTDKLDSYLKEGFALKKEYKNDIEVLVGMEFNLCDLDGTIDIPKGYENTFELKLIGVHKMTRYTNFKSILYMMGFQLNNRKRHSKNVININTNAYINAINHNDIDIIAHPSNIARVDMSTLASACEKTNTLLEINTRHPDLTHADVKSVLKTKANFILGSDAHRPKDIGVSSKGKQFIAENKIPLSRVVNGVKG